MEGQRLLTLEMLDQMDKAFPAPPKEDLWSNKLMTSEFSSIKFFPSGEAGESETYLWTLAMDSFSKSFSIFSMTRMLTAA